VPARRLQPIRHPDAFGLGEIADAGRINTLEWLRAAPCVVTHNLTDLPGVIERRFQDGQDAIGGRTSARDRLGTPVALTAALVVTRLAGDKRGLLAETLVPILDFACRELGNGGIADRER